MPATRTTYLPMILETTFNLTLSQVIVIAGALIAIGGNYWLLVHLGQEGSKMKDDIKEHGEHISGIKSDITALQKTADRVDRNLEKLVNK